MIWFTCGLEKYPENTKKKYSGLMCHWRKGEDPFHCYDFYFKQRMVPMIFNGKDKVHNELLKKHYQRDRIRPHDVPKNMDFQNAKDFRIWDYGCQFIHFFILDWSQNPAKDYRFDSCSLRLSSTDDNDWEIEFHPSRKLEVMKFVENNWKTLTLDDLEKFNKLS